MAEIVISVDELVQILRANGLIPNTIVGIKATEASQIIFTIKTGWFFPKFMKIVVEYIGFKDKRLEFKIVTNRILDRLSRFTDRFVDSQKLAKYGCTIEYPMVYFEVSQQLSQHLKAIQVRDCTLSNGKVQLELESLDF